MGHNAQLEKELDELKSRVESLTRIIEEKNRKLRGGAVDMIRGKAKSAGKQLRHYIEDSPVKEKYNEWKDTATEYEHRVEENVQKHPLISVGVAFGVGFLLSAIFGRR